MRLKKAIIFILLFAVLPAAGRAESNVGPRLKEYVRYAMLPHLWDDLKNVYGKPETWLWLGAGTALTVGAHQYQWQVNDYYEDHKVIWGLSDFGNDVWGRGELQAGLAISMMFTGWGFENEKLAATGEVLLEAQAIQGAIINIIKPIAQKERPNESNNMSFPSGHTGTAFCTAAVLHHRYGWKLGVPAYTLAVITGAARMDVQAHWLPDVVMGATIAMVTGYGVSMYHDDHPYDVRWKEKPKVVLAPMFDSERQGIVLNVTW